MLGIMTRLAAVGVAACALGYASIYGDGELPAVVCVLLSALIWKAAGRRGESRWRSWHRLTFGWLDRLIARYYEGTAARVRRALEAPASPAAATTVALLTLTAFVWTLLLLYEGSRR